MKCLNHLLQLLAICCLLNFSILMADEPATEKKEQKNENIEIVNLSVYPAPIPRPALKYRLLPNHAEQTPGNAALIYYQIFQSIQYDNGVSHGITKNMGDKEKENEAYWTAGSKLSMWSETPFEKLPKAEIHKILDAIPSWWMEYLQIATHRMDCDWGDPIRELKIPFEMNLDYVQSARELCRVLATKARLELAEGKTDEALNTLQMGFTLSQHIGRGKVLIINNLVGIAIAGAMRVELLDLTQVKDSPNMYWSLSVLPHPFLSYKDSLETEEISIEQFLPELREAKTGRHSPEQWQDIFEKVIERINVCMEKNPMYAKPMKKYDAKKLLADNYQKSKEYLVSKGREPEEVEKMAPAQVILLCSFDIWQEMIDDSSTWASVDYLQWPAEMRKGNWGPLNNYEGMKILPFTEFFPAISAIAQAQWRTERDFESLRIIEAIRLFAYNHDGKLPEKLDEIKEVPIPANPMTGKPFPYRLEGDTAVLRADGHVGVNYEYHIKIAK